MATDKIWKAAEKGDKKAIERCLEQGESINSCDPSFRNTPLHWAVLGNYQFDKNELIDFLVERGADLNARMTLGRTPLHFAAYYGFCETATHLLELGADSTIQDDKGMTPEAVALDQNKSSAAKVIADFQRVNVKPAKRGL